MPHFIIFRENTVGGITGELVECELFLFHDIKKMIMCLKISGLFGFSNKTNCQANQLKCHIGDLGQEILVTNTNLRGLLLFTSRSKGGRSNVKKV